MRWARLAVCAASAVAACWAATGCAEPTVDTVAVWAESVDDGQGRDVQVYERGLRFSVRLEPDVAGSDLDNYGLAVDPRGLGVAQRGNQRVAYSGLRDARQPVLSNALFGGAEPAEAFAFMRNGDGLLRAAAGASVSRFAFMPTTSASAGTMALLEPPNATPGPRFELISASDAPVFVWVEALGSPSRVDGQVVAYGYPSEFDPGGIGAPAVTELGRGLVSAAPPLLTSDLQVSDRWCPHRACLTPSGRSLITPAAGRCRFWSWQWSAPQGPEGTIAPNEVVIEAGCPDESRPVPSIFAAIDDDLVVLDDADRVYLADLTARRMTSIPKLWSTPGTVRFGAGGRVAALVSDDGRMVHVGPRGLRIISGDSLPCPGMASEPQISPNGLWMVRVCVGDGTFTSSEQSLIHRVSPLGAETFLSVPMQALGIDDRGHVLMYSTSDSGEPRGLFVLDDDGEVSRIDGLEPEPESVDNGAGGEAYFATPAFLR